MLTIGSLFSGIGGLELGLEWVGLGPVLWQVEKDPFCRRVLERHWPDVKRFEDVRTVGAAELTPADLICGGFPCQDISSAGKGAGLAGKRSGLWREFARVVEELRPPWVVVENVASGARRWVDQVAGALEQRGYEVLPVPLSAADVGAPHLRRRVFLVAHAVGQPLRLEQRRRGGTRRQGTVVARLDGGAGVAADASGARLQRLVGAGSKSQRLQPTKRAWSEDSMPEPAVRRVDDGIPNRVDRLRALGNAVVPQCAEVVGWVVRELAGLVPEEAA